MAQTILVVEDDNNQRDLYVEELTADGYNVLSAADGRQALGIARESTPDLVILDINMPVMDGLDTLSRLLEDNSQVPVIINTAYASYQDSFSAWSADAYVVKSSDLKELKETIARLLKERGEATAA